MIFLATLPFFGLLALQVPYLQTTLAKRVAVVMSKNINGTISIDKLQIVFFNKVILQNASVISDKGDTLGHVDKLAISISTNRLMQGKLKLNRVSINGGEFSFIKLGDKDDNTSNISDIFNTGNKENEKKGFSLAMEVGQLRIKNFGFNYIDSHKLRQNQSFEESGVFDYSNIRLKDINLRLVNLVIDGENIKGNIQKLSTYDVCGYNIKELKGDAEFFKDHISLRKFSLSDNYSLISAKVLELQYDSLKDLSDFHNKVYITAYLENSLIDLRSISYFAPSLKNNPLSLYLSGDFKGKVSDIYAESVKITTPSGLTFLNFDAVIKNLPAVKNSVLDIDFKNLYTNTNDIALIIGAFGKGEPDSSILHITPDVRYNFVGNANGKLFDFNAKGKLYSSIGDIELDTDIKLGEDFSINGLIETNKFNLGKIINNDIVGELTIRTRAKATFKQGSKLPEFILDSLKIIEAEIMNYKYSNIFAVGELVDETFDGRVICHDPNLDFLFQGVMTLRDSEKNNRYNFYADVAYANLEALNIDKRGGKSEISIRAIANLYQSETGDYLGEANLRNLIFTNDNGIYDIGNIYVNSLTQGNSYTMNLDASFIKAEYRADAPITSFIESFSDILLYNNFKGIFEKKENSVRDTVPNTYSLEIETFDTKSICEFISPNLYIAEHSSVILSLIDDKDLSLNIQTDGVLLNDNQIEKLDISIFNISDSTLYAYINSEDLYISGINIANNYIEIVATDNTINLNYIFDNNSDLSNKMDLNTIISFDKKKSLETHISINESEFFLQGEHWKISPSKLLLSDKKYSISDFNIYNNSQNLSLDGVVSKYPSDTIRVALDNFDISMANLFLSEDLNLQGKLNGNVQVNNIFNELGIFMDIKGDSLSILDQPLGNIEILSKWDQPKKRFNLILNNRYDTSLPLSLSGYFQPEGKVVNVNINFDQFPLTPAEAFLTGILSDVSGTLDGEMELSGTLKQLSLRSRNAKINDLKFIVDYTKVGYTLNGPIEFNSQGVSLHNLSIVDRFGNSATFGGNIDFRYFKDFNLNTRLSFNNLQCLNTNEHDNSTFYGSAFGSGIIDISGPLNKLFMDVRFSTNNHTSIHVPLNNSAQATQSRLLSFKETTIEDINLNLSNFNPPPKILSKENSSSSKGMEMEIKVNANIGTESEVFIEINKQAGDVLRVKGNGIIDLDINTARGLFDLKGNYNISEGSYRFVALVISRDFLVDEGSSINFNGNIKQTNLNVTATYRTKAAISPLISSMQTTGTSSTGGRRNVDCKITMSGSLTSPELDFAINIPDLDPTTRGYVENALSTEDKVLRQFMMLLISGSFIPEDPSGIFDNVVSSTATDIVANQVNKIFTQLGIPIDLGFNYYTGQEDEEGISRNGEIDLAISTKLFNDRLIINGNFGNRNGKESDNFVGDIDVEIKVDKQGKTRMTLFSHSADDYSYLDNTQRSGIGITYQDEFNNFKELWQSIFYSKARREEIETRLLREAEAQLKKEAEEAEQRKRQVIQPKDVPYRFY